VPWEEVGKLLAGDGAEFDQLGLSVSISGNIAVIGASHDGSLGSDFGSAYVFDITTGKQLFQFRASDGEKGDLFGSSVAINGNIAVIGAVFDDDQGSQSGSAYVFDISTGQQLFKLKADDGSAGSYFGQSVAISNELAVIGAYGDNDNGELSGAAYLYDITTGQQLFKLHSGDGEGGDLFGSSVAISKDVALIGARHNTDNGIQSGAVYVFDVSTGETLFKLLPSDGIEGGFFGSSVAIYGNTIAIGAPSDDDNGSGSGAVYIFDLLTGQQRFKILAKDGTAGAFFGESVSVNEKFLLVGADGDSSYGHDFGAAYVFDITTGEQVSKLLPAHGAVEDYFGLSVALSGDIAIIGEPNDDDNGVDSGAAYVFKPRVVNYLSVEPFPLVGGEAGVFSFVGGVPDAMSWLLYSVDGLGRTFIKPLNVTIDLVNPRVALGPGLTDGDGNREVVRMLPGVAEGVDVWFQVVQRENVTNFFRTEILP